VVTGVNLDAQKSYEGKDLVVTYIKPTLVSQGDVCAGSKLSQAP